MSFKVKTKGGGFIDMEKVGTELLKIVAEPINRLAARVKKLEEKLDAIEKKARDDH